MTDSNVKDAVEFMLRQFKPERYAYLTVTIASFLLLLACIILFVSQNKLSQQNIGYIAGMVGSGGAIAYTASQLLRMWKDCINLFSNTVEKTQDHD